MKKLDKQKILQVTDKISGSNFYDFMDRYNITYGELLGAIDSHIHSASSCKADQRYACSLCQPYTVIGWGRDTDRHLNPC